MQQSVQESGAAPALALNCQRILDAFSDAFVAADRTGTILYCNRSAERLLEWDAGALAGRPLLSIIPPRLHEAHGHGFRRFLETREPRLIGRPVRVPALRRDGSEVEIELTLTVLEEEGAPLFVAALRDISDRVELERQLAVTKYLKAASTASAKLTTHLDLQPVLQTVVETLTEEFDAALARIWLYDPATNTLRLRASAGLSTETTESSRAVIDVANYPFKVGEVARTRRPYIRNGLLGVPQFDQDWVRREGLRSVAGFPLLSGDELRGVFIFFSRSELQPEVAEVLETFASMVSASLNNVELFQREQEARREAERERDRRRHQAHLLDSVEQAVIATDGAGTVNYWNRSAERLYGWTAEEALGRSILDLTPAEEWGEQAQEITERLRAGESWSGEFLVRRKDGSTFPAWVTNAPIRDASGVIVGVVGVSSDISERKRLEEALRRSEEQFRSLVEQSPLSVQVLSPDGWTLQVNRAWERLWDARLEDMSAYNMLQDEQLVEKGVMPYIRRAFAGEAVEIPPILYDRARLLPETMSGESGERWVRAFAYPVRDETGTIRKVVLVHDDFTDRMRLEQQLRDRAAELTEAAHQKDEFLAMLAHELRNPLGAVRNAVEVLAEAPPESAAFGGALERVRRQVQHQVRMVEDLLDVSRINRHRLELRREEVDLAALAGQTAEDYRRAAEDAGLTFRLELPDSPVTVEGDPLRLSQVLVNLLTNAIKFTEPGDEVTVRLAPDAGRAVLTVRDTGIGIRPELMPRLFDSFVQEEQDLARSRGGLGLGLAIVKGLVELHGGTVQARSPGLDAGTEVEVTLPLRKDAGGPRKDEGGRMKDEGAGAQDLPPSSFIPHPSARRVLVIEDLTDAAETLRDLLEIWGHQVEIAASGPEGIESARAWRPDVVLCDLGLPGMDGYTVAAALRQMEETREARIVAVSGYGGPDVTRRCREAGFDLHLEKPVELDALRAVVAGETSGVPG